jgi:hypothetical protein
MGWLGSLILIWWTLSACVWVLDLVWMFVIILNLFLIALSFSGRGHAYWRWYTWFRQSQLLRSTDPISLRFHSKTPNLYYTSKMSVRCYGYLQLFLFYLYVFFCCAQWISMFSRKKNRRFWINIVGPVWIRGLELVLASLSSTSHKVSKHEG